MVADYLAALGFPGIAWAESPMFKYLDALGWCQVAAFLGKGITGTLLG